MGKGLWCDFLKSIDKMEDELKVLCHCFYKDETSCRHEECFSCPPAECRESCDCDECNCHKRKREKHN